MKKNKYIIFVALRAGIWISTLSLWGIPALNAQFCDCSPLLAEEDSLALVEFFNSMGGSGWDRNDGWGVPGVPVSEWYGISGTTEEGCVVCLDLDGFLNPSSLGECEVFDVDPPGISLSGVWPENFCLSCLTKLSLSSNFIGERFPDFSCLTELEELYLEEVGITDTIPDSFFTLTNLRIINLGDNGLFGNISPEFLQLRELQFLYLDNNDLSGTVPDFSDIPGFQALDIRGNKFTFQDILPHITQIQNLVGSLYWYQNQDSVYYDTTFTVGLGLPFAFDLGIDDTVTTSTYRWYRDGIFFDSSFVNRFQFDFIAEESEGAYHCEIKNAIATELTLFSRVIQIKTCTPAIHEIFEALCPGEVLDLGDGMMFDRDTLIVFRGAAANGCDSAIFVQLTFLDPVQLLLDTTICEGTTLVLGEFQYEAAGMYQDTLFGAGANGCDSVLVISLSIASQETLGAADTGDDLVVCDSVAMLNASFPPPQTWGYWKAPDFVSFSDAQSPLAIAIGLQPGENLLWWYLATAGCEPYDSAVVELYFEPKPIAEDDLYTLYEFEMLDTNIVSNDSNLGFLLDWEVTLLSLPERGSVSLDPSGRLTYIPEKGYWGIQTFQYALSSSRCEGDTAEVVLDIVPKLDRTRPPNVITPNGDNYNDVFIIPELYDNPTGFPNSRLFIYNAEGECLFMSANYQNDWGGTSQNGNPLPGGVYYFVFYYEYDKPPVERGSVLIIR
jgi:gliding motility-associated-like protein